MDTSNYNSTCTGVLLEQIKVHYYTTILVENDCRNSLFLTGSSRFRVRCFLAELIGASQELSSSSLY